MKSKVEQVLDAYGNATWTKLYDWNSLTTPARTYNYTYLSDANYTSRYIRNRLLTSRVTNGTQAVTLLTNAYENGGGVIITDPCGLHQHDPAYTSSFLYRGNVISRADLTGTLTYDVGGNATSATLPEELTVGGSYQSSTNFAVPSSITTNTLTGTMQWPPSSV